MGVSPWLGSGLTVKGKWCVHLAAGGVVGHRPPATFDPGVGGERVALDADDKRCVESASSKQIGADNRSFLASGRQKDLSGRCVANESVSLQNEIVMVG